MFTYMRGNMNTTSLFRAAIFSFYVRSFGLSFSLRSRFSDPSNVPGTFYRFLNSPAPEYPINEYMVIHDPGSNTVNNILMLGRLLRSMFHSKMSFTISYKAYVIEPLYENRQADPILERTGIPLFFISKPMRF